MFQWFYWRLVLPIERFACKLRFNFLFGKVKESTTKENILIEMICEMFFHFVSSGIALVSSKWYKRGKKFLTLIVHCQIDSGFFFIKSLNESIVNVNYTKKITNNALVLAAAAAPLETSLFWHSVRAEKRIIIVFLAYSSQLFRTKNNWSAKAIDFFFCFYFA